jgi:hypothetical protein
LLLLPLMLLLLLLQVENALQVEGQRIPNLTHPDVPIGEEDNATVLALVSAAAAGRCSAADAVTCSLLVCIGLIRRALTYLILRSHHAGP